MTPLTCSHAWYDLTSVFAYVASVFTDVTGVLTHITSVFADVACIFADVACVLTDVARFAVFLLLLMLGCVWCSPLGSLFPACFPCVCTSVLAYIAGVLPDLTRYVPQMSSLSSLYFLSLPMSPR